MMSLLRAALLLTVLAFLAPAGVRAAAVPVGLTVPGGFTIERIATVESGRELAVAPNGDLFVATSGNTIDIVADAEGDAAPAKPFTQIDDHPLAGITIDGNRMYLGAQFGVYELPYHAGDRTASAPPRKIASVRTSGKPGVHVTTTVAVAKGRLYASVGSSCNNCDPRSRRDAGDRARAEPRRQRHDGQSAPRAQCDRASGESADPARCGLGSRVKTNCPRVIPTRCSTRTRCTRRTADYGWPFCYENHQAVNGHDCSAQNRSAGRLSSL